MIPSCKRSIIYPPTFSEIYISVRFLSWECWDFWRRHDHFRGFPKKSKVFRRCPKSAEVYRRRARSQCFSLQKSEIARKVLSFIHFTHSFRSLHGSELTYFRKLCQPRRQQLTFFNQAWKIGPQAWAGMRLKFSTRVRVGRYTIIFHLRACSIPFSDTSKFVH